MKVFVTNHSSSKNIEGKAKAWGEGFKLKIEAKYCEQPLNRSHLWTKALSLVLFFKSIKVNSIFLHIFKKYLLKKPI